MALGGTARGTGSNTTAGLSFTLSPSANFTAGNWAVLALAVDNADTSGTAHSTFTVTDSIGNTWTRRNSTLYDPGAANAGTEGASFTCAQNVGALQTGTVITVTFDASTAVKTWTLTEVTKTAGATIQFVASGNLVFGFVFNEYGTAQTPTGDADTTNGSWSTLQTAEAGTTAAGQSVLTQWKTVTATATQTYNPTLGTSSDCIAAWMVLTEVTVTDFPHTASGGAVTGGGATTTKTQAFSHAASGGMAADGVATVAATLAFAFASTGGVVTDGAASVEFIPEVSADQKYWSATYWSTDYWGRYWAKPGVVDYPYSADGGAVTSGSATIFAGRVGQASGGAVTGGAATVAVARAFSAVSDGGLVTGGAATLSRNQSFPASGGALTSGAATAFIGKSFIASGGLLTDGVATTFVGGVFLASGGLVTGGVASASYDPAVGGTDFPYSASGGAETGGAATIARTVAWAYTASGGGTASGASSYVLGKVHLASGGAILSGSATAAFARAFAHAAVGGIQSGGSAFLLHSLNYAATGGVATGGEAFCLYQGTAGATGKFRRFAQAFGQPFAS
jgi:hypothetical protein